MVDSDVMFLAIRALSLEELLAGFGPEKTSDNSSSNSICSDLILGRQNQWHHHSDTTLQFLRSGKKTAWATWNSTPGITDTLVARA